MIRKTTLHLLLLLTAFALTSCSGLPKGTGGGGGGGNGTVSFTLVADTPPASFSILSFKITIASVTLTPTTGTAQTFIPASSSPIDLVRLQSDTAFLGSLANVPAGTYTVQVSLSSTTITFANSSGSTILAGTTNCPNLAICTATLSSTGTPSITSFTFTAASGGNQGIELDFNLNNALTVTNGTLTVNFTPAAPNPGVLTAFTLPRSTANLGSGQLEIIEDFTGVVSLSGNTVTVTKSGSNVSSSLAATESSTSFFDASPDGTMCPTPATFSCVKSGQIASVDVFLNSDGTLALKEFEPLTSTQVDLVEGTVVLVTGATQFVIAVTDETPAATGSLIGSVATGQLLTVNLATVPPPQPFFVDTKGLAVSTFPQSLNYFATQTDTTAIHPGQTVAVHVTAFTAAVGANPASVVVDTVTLRWSRFSAAVQSGGSPAFTITGLPSYFDFTAASLFQVQTFVGTAGADGITNFDGITDATGLTVTTPPVEIRGLFLENTSFSAQPAFFAAKVRQQ